MPGRDVPFARTQDGNSQVQCQVVGVAQTLLLLSLPHSLSLSLASLLYSYSYLICLPFGVHREKCKLYPKIKHFYNAVLGIC